MKDKKMENRESQSEEKTAKLDSENNKSTDTAEAKTEADSNAASEAPAAQTEKNEAPVSEEKGTEEIIAELKQQVDAGNNRYVRLMAEFDNFKKRISRDYEKLVDSANEKLMVDMVEVRENFERALKSGASGADGNALLDGMKLIFSKFDTVLNKNGLEPFGAEGEPFDPQAHDALMKTAKDGIPEDHIAEIYERGYKLKGKVIKHAKVIVSSGAPETKDSEKNDQDTKDSK